MQNTSHAVMAQRAEPNDSLDDFPTMPWGTRALVEKVLLPLAIRRDTAWEPACNRGYMSRPLKEYFDVVHESDVHDYGIGARVDDFLYPTSFPNSHFEAPRWVITNPPFRLAEEFITRARKIAKEGVAVLTRTAFLESATRYNNLFRLHPPSIVAQFVERLPMVKGRTDRSASTATAYCWLVWCDGFGPIPTKFQWIPPCRKQLERSSDYDLPSEISTDGFT